MKKMVMGVLIIVCSLVIIGSFFMPWAKATTTASKVATGIKETVARELKGTSLEEKVVANFDKAIGAINEFGDVKFKTVVSGYEIPVLVNRKDSKTAISLAQVFTPDAENLGKKVLLVYLLPLMALLCIAFTVLGLKNELFVILIAIISGTISLGGLFKVSTANIQNNVVQITLERGLWQTLYGYLFIFIISVAWIVLSKRLGPVSYDKNK